MKQSSEGFENYFGRKSLKSNNLRFLLRIKKIENPVERVFDFSFIFIKIIYSNKFLALVKSAYFP